jgi:PAS domain S-box-containing protein
VGSIAPSMTGGPGSSENTDQGPLLVLLVEDSAEDAELIVRELRRSGLAFEHRQVEDERGFIACLEPAPDVVIADYHLPLFSGERALTLLREREPDVPFIVASGTIGEERAAAMMRLGANDYLLKDRLGRLGDAVHHAREEQMLRRANRAAEAALQESETRFRRLAENAQDLIFRYRAERGRFDYMSPAVTVLTGYTPEDFYADPGLAFRLAHPEDCGEQTRAFTAGTDGRTLTLRWIRRDGRLVWTEQRNVSVRAGGGFPMAVEGIIRDVTERKNSEEATAALVQDLRAGETQRRVLVARLVTAKEEESRRIAADIHDDSIQIMASAGMRLGVLARQVKEPAQLESLRMLEQVVGEAITRLRRQMVDLRPVSLDGGGLVMVLEDYLDQCRQDLDMTFDFQSRLTGDLPAEIQITLFRIAQEALANVRKHAVARHVEIRLDEVAEGVALRITDDGIGMASPIEESPLGHLGLTGMRERAETAGGWCRVGGQPGAGTTVECWMPAQLSDARP